MIPQPIHVLNQTGVLTSFSIAQKITEEDIQEYVATHKKLGKKDAKVGEILKQKILDEIQKAVSNNEVPGLVTPQELAKNLGLEDKVVKNIPELNRLVTIIGNKIREKNYDTMSLCYFINSLVTALDLGEDDFEEFNKQTNPDEDDEDDDGEESDTI
jgi:ribosomal protein S25